MSRENVYEIVISVLTIALEILKKKARDPAQPSDA